MSHRLPGYPICHTCEALPSQTHYTSAHLPDLSRGENKPIYHRTLPIRRQCCHAYKNTGLPARVRKRPADMPRLLQRSRKPDTRHPQPRFSLSGPAPLSPLRVRVASR